jgi:hypothetical protein
MRVHRSNEQHTHAPAGVGRGPRPFVAKRIDSHRFGLRLMLSATRAAASLSRRALRCDRRCRAALAGALASALALADPVPPIDRVAAERLLSAFHDACQRDHGQLWGASLCGSMMLTDPQTRVFVANIDPDAPDAGVMRGLFIGTYPGTAGVANTSVSWHGLLWAR